MEKTLLFVLILSGLSAQSTYTRDYYYSRTLMTWADAQYYCRQAVTDLATVDTQDENIILQGLPPQQDREKLAWIGLYNDRTNFKWSLGNVDFDNDTDFRNWAQEDDTKPEEFCTVMTKDGFWHYASCLTLHPAVCYYGYGPTRYFLVQAMMTWKDAVTYCRYYYTDLASASSWVENDRISVLVSVKTWIGLHRKDWAYWSDLSPTIFTNWIQGQPNIYDTKTSCVAINIGTGMWSNINCNERHYSFCQYVLVSYNYTTTTIPADSVTGDSVTGDSVTGDSVTGDSVTGDSVPGGGVPGDGVPGDGVLGDLVSGDPILGDHRKTTFKLKFQSEVDLNDRAVQQQILDQLHVELKIHGKSRLHWIQMDVQKEQKRKEEEVSCV